MRKKKSPERQSHLDRIISNLWNHYGAISDSRMGPNHQYQLADVVMTTLGSLFFQVPSMAEIQRRMQSETGTNNLKTLFKVGKIPAETQFREILGNADREEIQEGIHQCILYLERNGNWNRFRWKDGRYLVLIDATETHRSEKICCEHCLRFEHKDGRVDFAHRSLAAVLVHPDEKEVLPLMCEEIRNNDGTTKQDCEINAAKRLLPKLSKRYPHLEMVIVGDGLYSKAPMIELCNSLKLDYLFVAKPSDHTVLEEDISGLRKIDEVDTRKVVADDGSVSEIEFINGVHATGASNLKSNWIRVRVTPGRAGKKSATYINSWVTSIKITSKFAPQLPIAGRSRWKIENETFNALKRNGYHLEHNYGHNNKNLPANLISLNMLAFLIHQILYLIDDLFMAARDATVIKRNLYESMRLAVSMMVWPDWQTLFSYLAGFCEKLLVPSVLARE